MILFVHIPKTAGTSFRKGIEQTVGSNHLLLDYSPNAPETDEDLRKIYEKKTFSPENVTKLTNSRNIEVICGHFPFKRYFAIFPSTQIVTFIREPLQRCYSEFLHFQRHKNYKKRFKDFIELPRQINVQSRYLLGFPESGIIGVSEFYNASVQMINSELGLSIPSLQLNCNRKKLNQQYGHDLIGEAVIEKFYELNSDDVKLYEEHLKTFMEKNPSLKQNEIIQSFSTTAFRAQNFIKKISSTLFHRS